MAFFKGFRSCVKVICFLRGPWASGATPNVVIGLGEERRFRIPRESHGCSAWEEIVDILLAARSLDSRACLDLLVQRESLVPSLFEWSYRIVNFAK